MKPRWQKSRWSARHERQREAFARELERQGHHDQAERARACCKLIAISALDCCAAEQRLLQNTCGIRGCPVCAHAAAKREEAALWAYARHLRATLPSEVVWRHVVLTSQRTPAPSENPDPTPTVEELRADSRTIKVAMPKLWKAMQAWEEPALGLRCHLECGPSGMVHAHCLYIGPWIDGGWLKRTWAELTGWGYRDEENGGELRAVCQVNALYHYKSSSDRRRGMKTIGASRAAFKELAKYLTSPKAGPELGARMSCALKDAPRSWGYGCFMGLRKLRESGELLEGGERGVQLQREPDAAPAVCPHCGTIHPRRRCTPFIDVITGALAFQKMRPVLELMNEGQARRERRMSG